MESDHCVNVPHQQVLNLNCRHALSDLWKMLTSGMRCKGASFLGVAEQLLHRAQMYLSHRQLCGKQFTMMNYCYVPVAERQLDLQFDSRHDAPIILFI